MAAYLAIRIIKGKLDYKKVFAIEKWKKFKEAVDEILTLEGRSDLIE